MNFDLNEEQQLFAASLKRFLGKDYAFEARRRIIASAAGFSAEVWRSLAELGALGLPLPSDFGGIGGGAVELISTMEALGEALLVEPFVSTVGLGAQLLLLAGTSEQKARLLPRIADGSLRLAFAHREAHARYDVSQVAASATREGAGYRLRGKKRTVLDAPVADRLIVSARVVDGDGGIILALVEPAARGVAMRPQRTLDGRRAADIEFDDVRVAIGDAMGLGANGVATIEAAIDFATALTCAEAVGAMRYANDATLEYLKTRKQFGVTIGSFQALQHRMVDMVIETEQARSMASLACAAVDTEADATRRRHTVSAAKIKIADACRHVAQESVQLHGGMGMTDEMKVSHTFRRLTSIAQEFGDVDHHLARFAATA